MSFETIKYELQENVAIITFNRPEALNALSLGLTKDLFSAVKKAVDDKARAVVLTGVAVYALLNRPKRRKRLFRR